MPSRLPRLNSPVGMDIAPVPKREKWSKASSEKHNWKN
jgi:hypothetical protein